MSADTVGAAQLRAFIERIERLEEEKKTIADDIKDIYAEAKGTGFDTKAIRAIIKLRKMDKAERAEAEAILDVYKAALGMLPLFETEPSYAEAKGRMESVQDEPSRELAVPVGNEYAGTSSDKNPAPISNTRDPHFLAVDDGQPRTTSTDACGANCDGLPPVAGHGGEQPKHYAKSEQSVTHSNTTLATSPEASRKAGEGALLPLSPAANPDDDVPDFLKRGAA